MYRCVECSGAMILIRKKHSGGGEIYLSENYAHTSSCRTGGARESGRAIPAYWIKMMSDTITGNPGKGAKRFRDDMVKHANESGGSVDLSGLPSEAQYANFKHRQVADCELRHWFRANEVDMQLVCTDITLHRKPARGNPFRTCKMCCAGLRKGVARTKWAVKHREWHRLMKMPF